ncbi:MAG: TolC family protein [Candidatus Eisenbacteria bacterium]|uniref:TolC family protein n=1 Tax=Eiseniibacteriota bacterium TaxID=2212470 RepID=A0A938BPR2_UNCEI|nr:TolC family protein [Candidatus Eisenbacteria bacterium]
MRRPRRPHKRTHPRAGAQLLLAATQLLLAATQLLLAATPLLLAAIPLLLAAAPLVCAPAAGDGSSAEASISEPGASPLTLRAAVRRALERNHALAAARHAEEAAVWSRRQARAQLLPTITLESSYTRLDDETVARANFFGREMTIYLPDSTGTPRPHTIAIPQSVFRDGYQTSIQARLLLLHPALWNGVSIAGAARDLAAVQLESALQETAHETICAFVELLRLRSLAALQERFLDQSRENVALAERLFALGRYAEADVLRWRVEEARQSGLLQQQARAAKLAAMALENLLAATPAGLVDADTTLPGRLAAEIAGLRGMDDAQWSELLSRPLDRLVAAQPQLAALDGTARMAELQHRQSATAMLPSLALVGSYGWQNNDTPALDGEKAWALTASLSLPLFSSFAHYSGWQATRHRALETRATVDAGRRGVLLAAEAARTALRSAAEQLRLSEAGLGSARRNHEIQRGSYTLGRLSNLEWVDAHLLLQAAEQARASAYYDLVLAVADYHQALGGIFTLLEE